MPPIDTFTKIKHLIRRLPDEEDHHFQAFLGFASLQFSHRTLEEVAKLTGYAYGSCKLWSGKYNWSERATEIDTYRWAEDYRDRQELTRVDNKKYILKNREIKEKITNVTLQLLDVVTKLTKTALIADEVTHNDYVETKTGQLVPTTTVIKMNAKVSDIGTLLNAVVRATRGVNDLPLEDREEFPAFTENVEDIPTDQLIAMRNENLTKIHVLTGRAN